MRGHVLALLFCRNKHSSVCSVLLELCFMHLDTGARMDRTSRQAFHLRHGAKQMHLTMPIAHAALLLIYD